MVTMGKFSKATHLFEIALTKHREMISAINSNSASRSSEDRYHGEIAMRTFCIHNDNDNDNDVAMVDVCDNFDNDDRDGYVTSESCFDDDDDLDSFFDNDDNDCDDDDDNDRLFPTTVSGNLIQHQPMSASIRRMSSCSGLHTISYSGQEANRPAEKWMHHQIYTLPIVMNQTEWKNAPPYVRSFVLIFNSAISHHLMGMELLLHHQQLQASGAADSDSSTSSCSGFATGHERHLDVARMLYKLAMEAYKYAVSFESGRISFGVDRLCFPAIFNNLSHVCKTLEGQGSQDAYRYDCFLLKTVQWIIHGTMSVSRNNNDSNSNILVATSNQTPVTTPRATTPTSNGVGAAANHPELNDCYDDDFVEVLDAFLENAFYLIGAPLSIIPAAAA